MKSSIAIVFCLLVLGVDSQRWFRFMKEAGQGRLKGWGQEVVFVSFKNLLEQEPRNQGGKHACEIPIDRVEVWLFLSSSELFWSVLTFLCEDPKETTMFAGQPFHRNVGTICRSKMQTQ